MIGDENVKSELESIMSEFKKKFDLEVQTGLQWKDNDPKSSTLSTPISLPSSTTPITSDTKLLTTSTVTPSSDAKV
jgi:hypothetical protein